MVIGSQGRFSTDLDFTGLEEHDHETVVLDMMAAFEKAFHGIQFTIQDDSYRQARSPWPRYRTKRTKLASLLGQLDLLSYVFGAPKGAEMGRR